jgi:glycosyltransferase involved in cell wall biosynthesis
VSHASAALVSVVMPCHNQARFLADALESVRAQSYAPLEIVVVDDGSTDDPASVVSRYSGVVLLAQANQGRCAARNAGAARSRGELLVFLDADDRLLPGAIEAGVAHLLARPDCALAAGHRVVIDEAGARLPERTPPCVDTTDYLTLLQTNFILTPAVAMFRRSAFVAAGGWDPSLHTSEDYELYLRIAREWPVSCHHAVVAEYRRHGANTSADAARMLRSTLAVIRMQRAIAYARPGGVHAYRTALTGWWRFWAKQILAAISTRWRADGVRAAMADLAVLFRTSVGVLARRIVWKLQRLVSRPPAVDDGVLAAPYGFESGALEGGQHRGRPGASGQSRMRLEH